jgi:hypothetical protein
MRLLLPLLLLLLSGCATIFSGTRREVTFTSAPSSTAVVFGGVGGEVLSKVQELSDKKDAIVRLLSPLLPDDARRFLEALTPDELLTTLFVILQPTAATSDTVGTLGALYARTPHVVRDVVTKLFWVAGGGNTTFAVDLKKGNDYAGIAWSPGRRAHLLVVESRFDFVSLLDRKSVV